MPGNNLMLNILVIEDNPGDVVLLEHSLLATDLPVGEIFHAGNLADARSALAREKIDLVFLDLSLPDSSGLDSYTRLAEAAQRLPVILLTGLTDASTALQALSQGAQDYLVKGDFDEKLLARAIRYSVERKRNLEYLRESEERYRKLFNDNPMPMCLFDTRNLRILEVNAEAVVHYGYSYEEFLTKSVPDIRLNTDPVQLLQELEAVRGNREVMKKGLTRHIKRNGDIMYAEITWQNTNFKGIPAILVLANDVTQRIQLENELGEQRLSRQKQITEAVLIAQEKERTEIGIELHDNVNQILGATNLYINTAMTYDEDRQENLERSSELISKAINEIRKISKSLITPGLQEIGLIESIEDIIKDVRAAKSIDVTMDASEFAEEKIDDRRKLTLFRIVQEQFQNIMKHAHASEILVSLHSVLRNIVLTITDNGIGFDTNVHRNGVGITNIISRVELFNGQVDIFSEPGGGCRLNVSIPVD